MIGYLGARRTQQQRTPLPTHPKRSMKPWRERERCGSVLAGTRALRVGPGGNASAAACFSRRGRDSDKPHPQGWRFRQTTPAGVAIPTNHIRIGRNSDKPHPQGWRSRQTTPAAVAKSTNHIRRGRNSVKPHPQRRQSEQMSVRPGTCTALSKTPEGLTKRYVRPCAKPILRLGTKVLGKLVCDARRNESIHGRVQRSEFAHDGG